MGFHVLHDREGEVHQDPSLVGAEAIENPLNGALPEEKIVGYLRRTTDVSCQCDKRLLILELRLLNLNVRVAPAMKGNMTRFQLNFPIRS